MRNKVILLLILLFTIQIAASQNNAIAQTKTITVPDDYPTIQSAIGNASAGDTVFVKEGTYYYKAGSYAVGILINKSINLVGQDYLKTILKPIFLSSHHSKAGIQITADNVKISGFMISGQADSHAPEITKEGLLGVDFPVNCQNNGVVIGSALYDAQKVYPLGVEIINNYIINNTEFGIVANGNGSRITNNYIINNYLGPISDNGQNNLVIDNVVEPPSSPDIPDFSLLVVVPLLLSLVIIALLIFRRHQKTTNLTK